MRSAAKYLRWFWVPWGLVSVPSVWSRSGLTLRSDGIDKFSVDVSCGMSERIATAATILAVVLAGVSLYAIVAGNYFLAGTVLTLVAFAIYAREMNTP